ncbi:MAG: hypothetical protein ISS49_09040 [Anaerolineae bacterium]|nr:hypothetical protein [Anaerolineae bacterium]
MKKLLILVLVLLVLLSAVVPVFAYGATGDGEPPGWSQAGATGEGPPGWSQVNPGEGGSDGPSVGPFGP